MKLLVVFCLLFYIDRFGVESLTSYDLKIFYQKLDHNATTPTYWKQKYYMETKYWGGSSSPIFLLIGGTEEIRARDINEGAWVEWGKKHKALMLYLEHRFYGTSLPRGDASTKNYKLYLNIQQALADIAYFIQQFNIINKYDQSNKWILVGGGYAGSLATWARAKYPDLIYGAVTSGAPLNIEPNFYQFYNLIKQSLNQYQEGCATEITKAIKSLQKLLEKFEGLNVVHEKLTICDEFFPFNKNDYALFFTSLVSPVVKAVLYDNQRDYTSIPKVCSYMTNFTVKDPLDRLANYFNSAAEMCVDGYSDDDVYYYQQYNIDAPFVLAGKRQWLFQRCNELGYFETSESADIDFFSNTIPISYRINKCTEVFGPEYNEKQFYDSVAATAKLYGRSDNRPERVISIFGSLDPWKIFGGGKRIDASPVIYIQGTSHRYDMLPPKPDDPPSLVKARNTTMSIIDKWLSQ